jgi:hypothetical protein
MRLSLEGKKIPAHMTRANGRSMHGKMGTYFPSFTALALDLPHYSTSLFPFGPESFYSTTYYIAFGV